MHSSLVRLQNTFGFFTTVAFVVAAVIAVSDLFAARTPTAPTLRPTSVSVNKGRPHYYSSKKEEYASIRFDLEADLSSLFTWNTKQVFVYVTAEWDERGSSRSSDSSNVTAANQAVIWDSIITSPSSDHLANLGPHTLKKLKKSAQGKTIDPSRGILKLKNQRPKYQITHPTGKLAQTPEVRLRLHYNVQPWVGVLAWNQVRDIAKWKAMDKGLSKPFPLPAIKVKETPKAKKA
ncbi:hypothetical protein MCOR27_003444 [Pyricularia oryzae]|uniref:Signal peptidase subunit 3 n=5 Tax=Pyricularia TaxID=48558 RepID=Q5EMY0_PYRGI|nr:uncharacterized protein MGG_07324 [Pyricularia oryzae 70-15]AAX07673.1 microsomal signal peptidase-like protein [Pyricularia grisea]ELQ39312.1 hypothetical protein OOU_Y34scaffold00506g6 [Pyricularia oryzae Y34]KAH8839935.1 hypothetical protein MCOR01_009103 [Pyricularia oryzae]EHA55752.1 hypothetical protein MGG_07324 [Pyricularia oryzae 70-15]KAH9439793.1 hypothetical protein MCOR02_003331 [Pyricularia oryzae]